MRRLAHAVRGGSPPRRRARAGGSRDVAGHRRAQRAGARRGGVEAGKGWRARQDRARSEAEKAQRTLLAADIKRFLERPADPHAPDAGAASAARRAYRRRPRHGLAGAGPGLHLERCPSRMVDGIAVADVGPGTFR